VTNVFTDLTVLERRLSVERLGPYRRAVDDDLGAAIALYEWNAEAAAALWVTLGHVEVLVRNAMHEQLTRWSAAEFDQPRWYLDPTRRLAEIARRDIADARRRATRTGQPETPGRVVAELTLGFWRYLLAARYERALWLTCLRPAFPGIAGRGMRRDVHDALADLHVLRNRIAHHEPVHNRPLKHLHRTALSVAEWVCPDTRRWIEARSLVEPVLAARPGTREAGPVGGRSAPGPRTRGWRTSSRRHGPGGLRSGTDRGGG
jgi:hypothetical protein